MLKNMSPVEVNALIARDLQVDAYADQDKSPVAYRGKRLAQGLEHALYWCPVCQEVGQITSRDDAVTCRACGLRAVYDPYGAFAGGKPFKNPAQWQDSQRAWLKGRVLAAAEGPVLGDGDAVLSQRGEGRTLKPVSRGKLAMSRQGLAVGEKTFPLGEIVSLEIYRKNILLLAARDGERYQIVARGPFSALKYRDMYQILGENGRQ